MYNSCIYWPPEHAVLKDSREKIQDLWNAFETKQWAQSKPRLDFFHRKSSAVAILQAWCHRHVAILQGCFDDGLFSWLFSIRVRERPSGKSKRRAFFFFSFFFFFFFTFNLRVPLCGSYGFISVFTIWRLDPLRSREEPSTDFLTFRPVRPLCFLILNRRRHFVTRIRWVAPGKMLWRGRSLTIHKDIIAVQWRPIKAAGIFSNRLHFECFAWRRIFYFHHRHSRLVSAIAQASLSRQLASRMKASHSFLSQKIDHVVCTWQTSSCTWKTMLSNTHTHKHTDLLIYIYIHIFIKTSTHPHRHNVKAHTMLGIASQSSTCDSFAGNVQRSDKGKAAATSSPHFKTCWLEE